MPAASCVGPVPVFFGCVNRVSPPCVFEPVPGVFAGNTKCCEPFAGLDGFSLSVLLVWVYRPVHKGGGGKGDGGKGRGKDKGCVGELVFFDSPFCIDLKQAAAESLVTTACVPRICTQHPTGTVS